MAVQPVRLPVSSLRLSCACAEMLDREKMDSVKKIIGLDEGCEMKWIMLTNGNGRIVSTDFDEIYIGV